MLHKSFQRGVYFTDGLSSEMPRSVVEWPSVLCLTTYSVDDGLPAKRSLRVYDSLTRHQAFLLIQLRTGYSWLATHARRWNFTDDDSCVCGAIEMVMHVVVDCPRLRDLRGQLRSKVGDAFSSIATMPCDHLRPRDTMGEKDLHCSRSTIH